MLSLSFFFVLHIHLEKMMSILSTTTIATATVPLLTSNNAGVKKKVPQRQFSWSPVALFRFSALTFNAHMIHYNECWTKNVEGHPAVVVHGPLNLIGMMDYWRDVHANGREAGEITYRALSPLYAGEEYVIRTEESSSAAAVTENGEEGEPRRRSWELAVVRGDKKCMKGTILAAA